MSRYFDRTGNPITYEEWIRAFDPEGNRVALDERNGVQVSTVFLAINHNWGDGPPLIFETMVFGGDKDEHCWRYSTEAEALAGHAEICSAVLREVSA